MAFKYEATVQHGKDTTEYVNLGKDGISVAEFEGECIVPSVSLFKSNNTINNFLKINWHSKVVSDLERP